MIRDVYSGSFASRIRISDSGVKKALDPGSESAKLLPLPLQWVAAAYSFLETIKKDDS